MIEILDRFTQASLYKAADAKTLSAAIQVAVKERVSLVGAYLRGAYLRGADLRGADLLKEWRTGYRILVVEFTAADIAAIPVASDGKFRVHRCTVVAEKSLEEVGLGSTT